MKPLGPAVISLKIPMQKLSFKAKILLMLASALLALIVMATLALVQERKLIIEQRQTTLLTAAIETPFSAQSATSVSMLCLILRKSAVMRG